jgi:hypothetical protein
MNQKFETALTKLLLAQSSEEESIQEDVIRRIVDGADAELAQIKVVLADPEAVRLNILRGTIKKPDDLVWLHDTVGPIAALRKQAEAGAMLAEVVRHVGVVINGDWLICPWCNNSLYSPQDDDDDDGGTPEFHHAPDCPSQVALAAWDIAKEGVKR